MDKGISCSLLGQRLELVFSLEYLQSAIQMTLSLNYIKAAIKLQHLLQLWKQKGFCSAVGGQLTVTTETEENTSD